MMASAWAERVPAGSSSMAARIAARASGGRSVEVLMMRATTESKNAGNISDKFTGEAAHEVQWFRSSGVQRFGSGVQGFRGSGSGVQRFGFRGWRFDSAVRPYREPPNPNP
jgi:hypothetical protein